MKPPTKNEKIFNFLLNTEHFVDSVESHENTTVVFTTDKLCFPINQVITIDSNLIAYFFEKIIKGEKLIDSEENFLNRELSSSIPDFCDFDSFQKKLKELQEISF